jgi:hypothetical protein
VKCLTQAISFRLRCAADTEPIVICTRTEGGSPRCSIQLLLFVEQYDVLSNLFNSETYGQARGDEIQM